VKLLQVLFVAMQVFAILGSDLRADFKMSKKKQVKKL